jgi:cell division protein FtsB
MDHTTIAPEDFAKLEYRADEAVAAICGLERDAGKADAIVLALWRDLSKPYYDALAAEVAALRAEVAALRREREDLRSANNYMTPRMGRRPLRDFANQGEREAYNAGYNRGYHTGKRGRA